MKLPPNPITPGWYADPEARFFAGRYWIYATRSYSAYEDQLNIDAFSSADLVTWDRHEGVIALEDFPHIWRAVWAPTIVEHAGRYWLVFASNDIQSDAEVGGLELAVADRPEGPFRAALKTPLVDRFVHQAQPIDAHLFRDDDGAVWLLWGGWRHCCVARLNAAMDGFVPFDDGHWAREITPPGYVEAPCLLKRNGTYYFQWSSGNWTDGTYWVSYATGPSPAGPFTPQGKILEAKPPLADGPGHNSYLNVPGTDEWLMVYHRRPVGHPARGDRYLCIDKMEFAADGSIRPVVMTGLDGQPNPGPQICWNHDDVGAPALRGRRIPGGNGIDLTAVGEDIWGTADQFGFLHRSVEGDFDLTVRVEALDAVHHYTKAGLMARVGTDGDAAHVFLLTFPADGARNNNSGMIEAQSRPAAGASCTAVYPPKKGVGAPEFPVAFPQVWLRLTRKRDHWTCRVGRDGTTWRTYAEFELVLPGKLEVGPAFTSHDGARSGVARFRDLNLG